MTKAIDRLGVQVGTEASESASGVLDMTETMGGAAEPTLPAILAYFR